MSRSNACAWSLWLRRIAARGGRFACGVGLLTALVLLLAACGGNSRGSQSAGGVGEQGQPTVGAHTGTGFCPNGTTMQQAAHPDVVISTSTPGDTTTAHVGETIEVELPATNMRWQLSNVTPSGALSARQPYDSLDATLQRCLWTYTATRAVPARLTFIGTPQCNPTQYCPQAHLSAFEPPSKGVSASSAPSVTYTPSHAIQIVYTIHIAS